ncbi:MAG: L-histidine N(alpha)-methyltransferase [Rubripirellula sp.]|nr:L-histidine N(alpha)-methyltransferase [Rubripirellula sp.]
MSISLSQTHHPDSASFHDDVIEGLGNSPRWIPCKYFYDERGSQLFDQICELDEYYLTRTELAIMERYAGEMADQIGSGVMLVEFGSGSSVKTRILLDHLHKPVAYVPVDISQDHLRKTAEGLQVRYPKIEVLPVCADFTEDFGLPTPSRPPTHDAVYFPGSTIGNFPPDDALTLLKRIVRLCGCGGGLLIGVDLQKDPKVIEAAYNDAQGITAAFNLNLVDRLREELGANLQQDGFEHHAAYNSKDHRVEIGLISRVDQEVKIGDRSFRFAAGELIHTEYSHKYTVDGFAALAAQAGLTLHEYWTDPDGLFAVLHLVIVE